MLKCYEDSNISHHNTQQTKHKRLRIRGSSYTIRASTLEHCKSNIFLHLNLANKLYMIHICGDRGERVTLGSASLLNERAREILLIRGIRGYITHLKATWFLPHSHPSKVQILSPCYDKSSDTYNHMTAAKPKRMLLPSCDIHFVTKSFQKA